MMSGAPRSGSLYWLTSVPQTPAISTFSSAASDGISGRSKSRSSVVEGPTFRAARDLSGIGINLSLGTRYVPEGNRRQVAGGFRSLYNPPDVVDKENGCEHRSSRTTC